MTYRWKKQASIFPLVGATLLLLGAMALVEAVWQPGYWIKSLCKVLLFGGIPLLLFCRRGTAFYTSLRLPKKKLLLSALLLGAGVYLCCIGGFLLLRGWIDWSAIAASLQQQAGVTAQNFPLVALYISFLNSLLEEFFFRGFLFFSLLEKLPTAWAFLLSALAFSLYHIFILTGWFSWWMFLLMLLGLAAAGLLFSALDYPSRTIYPSWVVHLCANLGINTIGMVLFGLLPLGR